MCTCMYICAAIVYHEGGVLLETPIVYIIWYGNWDIVPNTATTLIPEYLQYLDNSAYLQILTSYGSIPYSSANPQNLANLIPGRLTYGGAVYDNYSYGSDVSSVPMAYIITYNIIHNNLTLNKDSNGIYLVLTSADVINNNFCTSYCGYHSYNFLIMPNQTETYAVFYAYIGNSDGCSPQTKCRPTQSLSPNNNPGADGMINVISHEIVEIITDPVFTAWFFNINGYEIADECEWNFGNTYTTNSTGAIANMLLSNNKDYLVQQIWVNANGGYCGMHL
jgi:hypothetical protein